MNEYKCPFCKLSLQMIGGFYNCHEFVCVNDNCDNDFICKPNEFESYKFDIGNKLKIIITVDMTASNSVAVIVHDSSNDEMRTIQHRDDDKLIKSIGIENLLLLSKDETEMYQTLKLIVDTFIKRDKMMLFI